MTPAEDRAQCIEAMALEELRYEHGLVTFSPQTIAIAKEKAAHILDSLHGIARVNPIEATEEMVDAAFHCGSAEYEDIFRAMAARGDLTNPPESSGRIIGTIEDRGLIHTIREFPNPQENENWPSPEQAERLREE
jgi:hypothetical protein